MEWDILVSENDLFLTLGLGTSSAWNENLRPLLNTNISLISGKYGLLAVGKSFSHEEKWENLDFLKAPSSPDFDLLDS